MTTIAWDGTWLAADRQAFYGNLRREVRKIFEAGPFYYAIAGAPSEGMLIRDWLAGGDLPTFDEASAHGIVVHRETGEAFVVEGKKPILNQIHGKWANGSGTDLALAAMSLGKSAPEAVLVAARFDIYTGFGVDKVRVRPAKRGR